MHEIFGGDGGDKTPGPPMHHRQSQRVKLAKPTINSYFSIFIVSLYHIGRIFGESGPFRLNSHDPQIYFILLIVLHIQCKIRVLTDPSMINFILYVLTRCHDSLSLLMLHSVLFVVFLLLLWFMMGLFLLPLAILMLVLWLVLTCQIIFLTRG